MKHEKNDVTIQGPVGAPTVRLSREGPVFASVPLRISEYPHTEITVTGIGLEAAGIACLRRGNLLRVEGRLAIDPATREVYVWATAVARMEQRGFELHAVAPSLEEFDRLSALFDAPGDTPVPAPVS
jgi:hypothetical protein